METITEPGQDRPVTPPPRRRHRIRNFIVLPLAGLIVVIAVIAALGGSHAPAKAPARPAAITPASTAPASPSLAEKMAAWVNGPGGRAFTDARDDIAAVSKDAGNQDLTAVRADGAILAADASRAASLPPPAGTAHYTAAMKAMQAAGEDLAAGDIEGGTAQLRAATTEMKRATADIQAAGGNVSA